MATGSWMYHQSHSLARPLAAGEVLAGRELLQFHRRHRAVVPDDFGPEVGRVEGLPAAGPEVVDPPAGGLAPGLKEDGGREG